MARLVTSWKSSTQPRKQRKFRYNAPLHLKQKFMHVHLAAALRQKYGRRDIQSKREDKVKILRGQFKGKEGKVSRLSLMRGKIYVTGIENIKKDGSKLPAALVASNLQIIELNLEDKKRKQKLEISGVGKKSNKQKLEISGANKDKLEKSTKNITVEKKESK